MADSVSNQGNYCCSAALTGQLLDATEPGGRSAGLIGSADYGTDRWTTEFATGDHRAGHRYTHVHTTGLTSPKSSSVSRNVNDVAVDASYELT